MSPSFRRILPATAAVAAIALTGASPAMARHGADDPAGHDRGVHHRVHHRAHHHEHATGTHRAGHHRHGRGTDDGPNHR